MRTALNSRSLVHLACVALLAGGLDGCGGGGGGGGGDSISPPAAAPATLTITSLNSDAVGHSIAAGVLALPIATLSDAKVSLTGGGTASAAAQSPIALLRQFRAGTANGGGDRTQALEVFGTGEVPCNFGGTVSLIVDDADNSGAESPGDVETAVFHNCIGSVNETYNGTVTMRVGAVTDASTTYDVSLAQVSYVTPNHSLTVNGSYVAAVVWNGSVQNTTYTVNGSVTVALTTHVPFADTVTLQNGFVLQEQIDYGSGQNLLSATGMIESASAGGSVAVSTGAALLTWGQAGLYPTAGLLNVAGKAGALSITALSTTSVRVDVDTNDDHKVEKTSTPTLEWLL